MWTLRVIAIAFFTLAAHVTTTSLVALTARVEVEHSTLGIVITALSVVIMPSYPLLNAAPDANSYQPRPSLTTNTP